MFACFYSEVLIGSMSSLFSLVVLFCRFVCLFFFLMATVIALTFALLHSLEMLSVVDGAL